MYNDVRILSGLGHASQKGKAGVFRKVSSEEKRSAKGIAANGDLPVTGVAL
jgi:hypothetical protein